MYVAVVQFPGSNCDNDAYHAFASVLKTPAKLIWHKDTTLGDARAVIIPGGFSFGDYLRCGAIAHFSPAMQAVKQFADNGGPVMGICNGFQILCESGLLPGALIRNNCLEFRCQTEALKVEDSTAQFNTQRLGKSVRIPIAHGEGNYRIDDSELADLEKNKQILFRYASNPNGSLNDIAGIRNRRGNVFGMMPHPERACESFHPSQDGLALLQAFLDTAKA